MRRGWVTLLCHCHIFALNINITLFHTNWWCLFCQYSQWHNYVVTCHLREQWASLLNYAHISVLCIKTGREWIGGWIHELFVFCVNLFIPRKDQCNDDFADLYVIKAFLWKIFKWEMLVRTQPTTLFQIFCEFMCDSKFTRVSIIIADETCQGDL